MSHNMSGRHFLKLLDFSPEEIHYFIKLAQEFKRLKKEGVPHKYLEGKNIVLLFEKTSTRTRCSFEVAGRDLGMGVVYLDPASSQMGKKESIEDTARVLGRMFDAIEYRGYDQSIVECLAKNAGVCVFNGLTTQFHPTQMIADMLTLTENFGDDLHGLKLVFMGDAQNNVANSLMVTCAKLGLHFVACGPDSRMPEANLVNTCTELAKINGGSITLTSNVDEACAGAQVLYTDIWVSMGEDEHLWQERIKLLSPYKVTSKLMEKAAPNAIFMHCLPAFHDRETTIGASIEEKFGLQEMEVEDALFRSDKSKVFDEAENRMHSIKAIMYALLASNDAQVREMSAANN